MADYQIVIDTIGSERLHVSIERGQYVTGFDISRHEAQTLIETLHDALSREPGVSSSPLPGDRQKAARALRDIGRELEESAPLPTDEDAREELANIVLDHFNAPDEHHPSWWIRPHATADAILAAGFRRSVVSSVDSQTLRVGESTVVPTPSDEAVQRAADVLEEYRPADHVTVASARWNLAKAMLDAAVEASAVSAPPTITDDSDETEFVCGNCNAGIPDDHIGPKVKVTDEIAERAARAMFEEPGAVSPDSPDHMTWDEVARDDPTRADIWREDARRVLSAALSTAETHHSADRSDDPCPEWNCPDLSVEDRREGKTCPDHPCTCSKPAARGR